MKRSYGCFLFLSSLLVCGMLLISSAAMVPAVQATDLAGPATTPWPLFRHDTLHSGRSSYVGTQGAGIKWTVTTGGLVMSSPVLGADGTIYVGSMDGYLYAVTPNGVVKWKFATTVTGTYKGIVASPAIASDGTIYIGALDGNMYAVDPATGTEKWRYSTGGPIMSSCVIGPDGAIYFGSDDHHVYGLNSGGTSKWAYPFYTSNKVTSSPALDSSEILYVGSRDGDLYALHADNGLSKWSYYSGGMVISSPSVSKDGTKVLFGSDNGYFYGVDLSTGSYPYWTFTSTTSAPQFISSPAVGSDGTVYAGCIDGYLYALNPTNGNLVWVYNAGSPIISSPAVGSDGIIYFAAQNGTVYALRAVGTTLTLLWSQATAGGSTVADGVQSSPAIGQDGTIYIGAANKKLYAIKQKFTLTPAVRPAGAGSVTLTPSGGSYESGTTVKVKATAETNYVFDHWTGALSGDVNPSNIVMNANKSVTAVFSKIQYTLTPAVRPAGAGSVTLTPSGGTYDIGTTVTVKAVAGSDYIFDHWTGDLTGSANPSNLVMSGNKTVTAVFKYANCTLTAGVSPAGAGSVTLTPSGGTYTLGTTVKVKAVGDSGYIFDHWSGDLTGSTNPSSIVMNGNKSVTAVFTTRDSVVITVPAAPKVRANGYRMIGIPLELLSGAPRDVFSTIAPFFGGKADPYTWALYKQNGTTLIARTGVDTVKYGKGWWIVSTKAKSMQISGKPLTTDFRMSVSPVSNGKQMVACPFSDRTVPWANVVADSANAPLSLGTRLYYFNNGEYAMARTMEPGKAYWATIGNKSGGTLLIRRDYGAAAASTETLLAAEAEGQELPPPLAPGSHITVAFPKGGMHLKQGGAYDIQWSSSGISPEGFADSVNISISTDGGKNYTLIAEGVPNTGVYRWTVPRGAARPHCRIRISSDLYPQVSGSNVREFSISGK